MNPQILYPFTIQTGHKNFFSFAIELARRISGDITAFTTYLVNPSDENYLETEYDDAVQGCKNDIYCNLLEHRGYYQGFFNQWKNNLTVKLKSKLKEGSFSHELWSLIKAEQFDVVIVPENRDLLGASMEELFDQPDVTGIALPEDLSLTPPDLNLDEKNFRKQRDIAFQRAVDQIETIFPVKNNELTSLLENSAY